MTELLRSKLNKISRNKIGIMFKLDRNNVHFLHVVKCIMYMYTIIVNQRTSAWVQPRSVSSVVICSRHSSVVWTSHMITNVHIYNRQKSIHVCTWTYVSSCTFQGLHCVYFRIRRKEGKQYFCKSQGESKKLVLFE